MGQRGWSRDGKRWKDYERERGRVMVGKDYGGEKREWIRVGKRKG